MACGCLTAWLSLLWFSSLHKNCRQCCIESTAFKSIGTKARHSSGTAGGRTQKQQHTRTALRTEVRRYHKSDRSTRNTKHTGERAFDREVLRKWVDNVNVCHSLLPTKARTKARGKGEGSYTTCITDNKRPIKLIPLFEAQNSHIGRRQHVRQDPQIFHLFQAPLPYSMSLFPPSSPTPSAVAAAAAGANISPCSGANANTEGASRRREPSDENVQGGFAPVCIGDRLAPLFVINQFNRRGGLLRSQREGAEEGEGGRGFWLQGLESPRSLTC